MVLFHNNQKYFEYSYKNEDEIESDVITNSQSFFGINTAYIESKKKIDSKTIGATIPDGFLFDFSEIDNPEFFIVEVEFATHDFYKYIFPQAQNFLLF